mgnify:CR=1 FL=1
MIFLDLPPMFSTWRSKGTVRPKLFSAEAQFIPG